MDKKILRKQMLQKRRGLLDEAVKKNSAAVMQRLTANAVYRDAVCILTYISTDHEVDTTELIRRAWTENKQVFVPRVCGKGMEFYRIHSFEEVEPGAYGILEPKGTEISKAEKGLLIVPGVAFDKSGNRIGYGGGFYDAYISRYPDLKKVALAYEFQVLETIPAEDFDQAVDMIITENHIYDGKAFRAKHHSDQF